ncbi:glycosyltransferase [Chitinimonas viridis]|uniref:Glycosyltransferase n=1 Tax=Chitinimonas viridis TaxID=664880 RepID=A0ABT8BA19_9NEIS|nr:glycosyltransferase [Chitinimonas viridis]MDN3578637.1 glycosyltransferase [Chitinimonas viridis]
MLTILIPTWNNLPYLQACVESIRRHSAHAHEIILHLNDGSDGSLAWAKAQGIKYSHTPTNVGICAAMNKAAALATQDYIVFLNDDMVVLPGWDTALLEVAQRQPDDAFLLSGTMIEPRATGNACVIVADYGTSLETLREAELLADYASLPHADWQGASWPPTLVHRNWWQLVGGYSVELSPGMASDTDFAIKMWAAGCRVFHGVAASRVYHFQCRSTGRIRKNDGGGQFLAKWGITQSTFNRYYLRRGTAYNGPLTAPDSSLAYRLARLKCYLKRRLGRLGRPLAFD